MRIRALVLIACGGLALAVLVAFLVALLTRKGEVAQLVDILAGPNAPDAAWAFEELKEVGDEELTDLLEFIDDERVTTIHFLVWVGIGATGGKGFRGDEFRVGQVARFVLVARMGLLSVPSVWEVAYAHRSRPEWQDDLERFRATHVGPDGTPIEPRPGRRSFFFQSEIRPPSRQREERTALAGDRDSLGLVDVLKTGSGAEVAWAFEKLRELPDDELERTLPLAGSRDVTPVTRIVQPWGVIGTDVPMDQGRVVQFLLNERMGRPGSELFSMALDPEQVQRVESAWKEFRSKAR